MTAVVDRPRIVRIPGRLISTGGYLEHRTAVALDLAERQYAGARQASADGVWAATKGFADGVLAALAIFADVEHYQAEALYALRTGQPVWAAAGPPPSYNPPPDPRIPGQRTIEEAITEVPT